MSRNRTNVQAHMYSLNEVHVEQFAARFCSPNEIIGMHVYRPGYYNETDLITSHISFGAALRHLDIEASTNFDITNR